MAGRPPPSWSPRSPSSWKPMSGKPPAGRSTSTPGWPPTRCVSSSASCSTWATRPPMRRSPSLASPTRFSLPPPSGPGSWTSTFQRSAPVCVRWYCIGCQSLIRDTPRGNRVSDRQEGNEQMTDVDEVANQLFTAIENVDRPAADDLWDGDIAVWRTDGRDPTKTDDKTRALRMIDWFLGVTTQRRYQILDRQL